MTQSLRGPRHLAARYDTLAFVALTLALFALVFGTAGWLLGGLPTLVLLGYNGFLLGGVAADAAGTYGVARTAALLLPHGAFELPALWLAGAIGFRLTHVGWRVAAGNGTDTSVTHNLAQALAAAAVVLALLAVAAFVEAELTAPLADALT